MVFSFETAINTLVAMDFDKVILPFVLIFTIIYAILTKVKILGDKKNFNVVVAFVLALLPIFYHYSSATKSSFDLVNVLTNSGAISYFSTWLVVIIMLLILLGAFGYEFTGNSTYSLIIVISALLIIGSIFLDVGVSGEHDLFDFIDDSTQTAIVVILVFGVIVWFITKDDKEKEEGSGGLAKILKELSGGFTKK